MKTNYDMTNAKRGAVIAPAGKTRITIYLDDVVLTRFREKAELQGKGYQTLINETLSAAMAESNAPVTIGTLRQILREELHGA
jgi:uncharacterized protein (DUF4415 family)